VKQRRRLAVAIVIVAVGLLGAKRPNGLGDVVEVRHWSYPDYTRVVVEFDHPVVTSDVEHLPADHKAGRPERLYVDVEGFWVGRRFEAGIPVVDGLLQGVRLGQNTLTKTRVVIDVETYKRHRLMVLTHPHRLVLDVYGPRLHGEGLTWPGSPGEGSRRLPFELRGIQTVVIDPGHGGRDPGAIGVGGLREKTVTLKLANSLAPRLAKRGFRVAFTREDDRTVSLEERTAIAEAARGDIFVSLHTNASKRRSLNGIETYYLDKDYERHSVTVAARENDIDPSEVNDLQRTLARFRVSANSLHSRKLANFVQREVVEGLSSKRQPVQDLGVKKGPFYVLFLADTPAILLEAGFITNRMEAKRLADSAYIDTVAEQIADALVRYRAAARPIVARGD